MTIKHNMSDMLAPTFIIFMTVIISYVFTCINKQLSSITIILYILLTMYIVFLLFLPLHLAAFFVIMYYLYISYCDVLYITICIVFYFLNVHVSLTFPPMCTTWSIKQVIWFIISLFCAIKSATFSKYKYG